MSMGTKKVNALKQSKNTNLFKIFIRLGGISFGAILLAISYNALAIPYGLLSGGIGGIALLCNYVFGLPVHLGFLFFNIPIFVLGLKELDREFIIYSLICTIMVIFALPLTAPFIPYLDLDLILVAIFSGILAGTGIGIVFKFGGSTGGNDVISMIMKKKKNISIGSFSFFFNMMVLIASLYFFDLKISLYTAISMWFNGKMINIVIDGINHNKSVTIISDQNQIIAQQIMSELHRGVTYLKGEGAFSGNSKIVINCVLNHFEIAKIKQIVFNIDPQAFMYVTEIKEVSGKGFTF